MLNMTKDSRVFLKKYLPDALDTDVLRDALELLFDWIEDNGYAPPHYYDYNDLGREAQRVYDDLFLSNADEEALKAHLFPLKTEEE